MFYSISGVPIFIEDSIHVILSTVIFPDFNHAYIRSNKLDNLNMNISRFISTEQNMTVMDLKILQSVPNMLVRILLIFRNCPMQILEATIYPNQIYIYQDLII